METFFCQEMMVVSNPRELGQTLCDVEYHTDGQLQAWFELRVACMIVGWSNSYWYFRSIPLLVKPLKAVMRPSVFGKLRVVCFLLFL